jgi:two-component system C4-dicarboxylate transport response regulator DctD
MNNASVTSLSPMNRGLQILVVDDEPIVRRSIRMLLEHEGHKVTAVDSAEAAVDQLMMQKFDLLVTDFFMPGKSGDQLARHARQLQPGLPVIMSSAFVDDEHLAEAAKDVNVFLLKPYSLDVLREAIHRATL